MELTDEDFLNTELRNNIEQLLKKQAIINYTMDISAGTIKGDNYLGVIGKVVVTGEDKNGKTTKLSFIVKSAPRNELLRSLAPIRLVYGREIYMYDTVFPLFMKFQEERGILQPFKSLANYCGSTMKDLNEGLIMEDMKALGFDLCDRKKPLSYNHVMLVLREYGKFHALSYALRDQQPELFKQLADNVQEIFLDRSNVNEELWKFTRDSTDRALKSLDPVKDKVAYNKFIKFQDNVVEMLLHVVSRDSAGKYGVINHGDCWTNNILFKYDDVSRPNSPTELCFLDWQLTRTCSPALDLAYFIFACTDKKLRDEHYDDMIQEYYKSLSSLLRELGSDPDKMFPFKILQEHLKKFSVFGLYMATTVLHLMASDSDEVPDMQDAQNVDDLTKNFLFSTKNEEKFRQNIRGVILDFVKFDYDF